MLDNFKNYQIIFKNRAGLYKSSSKNLECLKLSLKGPHMVDFSFDGRTLEIKKCKKAK